MRCSRGTLLTRLGRSVDALPVSQSGLDELGKLSADEHAPSNILMLASDHFRSIEPVALRNPRRAVKLAERNVEAGQETEPYALYLLAMAYNSAGEKEQAKQIAQKALALIAPPRGKLVSYLRTDLETIR